VKCNTKLRKMGSRNNYQPQRRKKIFELVVQHFQWVKFVYSGHLFLLVVQIFAFKNTPSVALRLLNYTKQGRESKSVIHHCWRCCILY